VLPPGGQTEVLYLTRDSALVRVVRSVNAQPTIEQLVAHLTGGPTSEEQALGLASTLTAPSIVEGVTIDNGIITVALGDGLDGLAGSAILLAIGQIVCTLDAHPDVEGVIFTRDGERRAVPRGDGSTTEEPVTAEAYESLLESPEPPPS
jgi:spore germination protein GerM